MSARVLTVFSVFAGLAMLVTACGKKGGGPGKDWSDKPIAPVSESVKGVSFKVSLPEGMKAPEKRGVSVIWDADMDDNFSEPGVTVAYQAIPPATLKAAIADQMFDDNDVVSKEASFDGGFVIISHTKNKGIGRAVTYKKFGDKVLSCRASQAKTGGIPSFDKSLAWLESICMSLAP